MNPAACAGVRLEEHLTIRSETEERPKFDCFTGNKTGTFSTIQYYYTIGTREVPILYQDYPKAYNGEPYTNFGWDIGPNIRAWLVRNCFTGEYGEAIHSVWYHHSSEIVHPTGILGVPWIPTRSRLTCDWPQALLQPTIDDLKKRASELLEAVGITETPELYLWGNDD